MRHRRLWTPLSLVAAAGLCGCERSDPVADALEAGNREIAIVAYDADLPAPDQPNETLVQDVPAEPGSARLAEYRQRQLDAVVSSVAPATTAENRGQSAAAHLIAARAKYGLALDTARAFYDAEREFRRSMSGLSAEFVAWSDAMASAAAHASFDPSPELARIDAELARLQREMDQTRQQRQRVQQQIDDLRRQANDLIDRARAERTRQAALRERAIRSGPVEAADLSTQAAAHRREADRLEAEASRLLARVDTLTPEIAELDLRIEMLTTQQALYASARQSVQDRAKLAEQAAADARAQAAEAAERLRAAADALDALKRERIEPAARAALEAFDAVIASAGAARAGNPAHANLLLGEAHQARGNLSLTASRGLDLYAKTLAAMAEAEAFPLADTFRARSAQAADRSKALGDGARDAFTQARDAYQSAGRGGDAMSRARQVLDALIGAEPSQGGEGQMPDGSEATGG